MKLNRITILVEVDTDPIPGNLMKSFKETNMSIARISWKDDLNEKELEMLNDIMYVMGLQAGANCGLISQKRVSEESEKLNEKYKGMDEEIEELNRKIDKKFFER